MAIVLGSHRGKAGSAVQLRWPEADLMMQPHKAGLLMKGVATSFDQVADDVFLLGASRRLAP